jgi:hypothetical protein
MRLCVVGNSHVGALRSAYNSTQASSSLQVDFYAVPGDSPVTKDGAVVALESVHSTVGPVLDPSGYDSILVSAVGYWAVRNVNAGHPLLKMALSTWASELPTVSAGVFKRASRQVLVDYPIMRFCADLRTVFAGKIYFQPWPLPSSDVYQDAEWRLNVLYGGRAPAVIAYFYQLQYELLGELLADKGTLLPYPKAEWLREGSTPAELATQDPWHMGGTYGELVLAQLQIAA